MNRRLFFPALVTAFTGAAPGAADPGMPRLPADGALLRPDGVERWVLVGTSLGLGYSNATDDGVGMFHRVYLEPRAYEHVLRTGGFRSGTMLALSIREPVRRVPPSRAGWSEGGLVALELAVKDLERFRAPPGEGCAGRHEEHGARDNVFVQFYPQLRAR